MANGTINMLIDDCLLEIFRYFTFSELPNIAKVCRRWDLLCQELWKIMSTFACVDHKRFLMAKYPGSTHTIKNSEEMEAIFQHCGPFIKKLYLHDLSLMNDDVFASTITTILNNCVNLDTINIEDSFGRSISCNDGIDRDWDDILMLLLHKNTELESFSLLGTCKIPGKFLFYLPETLIELNLGQITRFSPSRLVLTFKSLKHLDSFTCSNLNDEVLKTICKDTAITKLSFEYSHKLTKSLNDIAQLVNLKELNIGFNNSLKDNDLIVISNNCKLLRVLDISECVELTNCGIFSLAKLTNLEQLQMQSLKKITDEPIGDLSERLKQISCMGCEEIRDDGIIKLIERASELDLLNLIGCRLITNRTLEAAIVVTKERTNNIKLIINCFRTLIDEEEIKVKYQRTFDDISSLLTIR